MLAFGFSALRTAALEVSFPQQCFTVNKDAASLESDPIWLNVCVPAGKTCAVPATPQLDTTFDGSGSDNVQAGTVMVSAVTPTVPEDTPTEHWRITTVSWQAADLTTGQGSSIVWAYHQKQGVPTGLVESTVHFGASGLHAGRQQQFRVGYCATQTETQQVRCSCYSDWSAVVQTDDLSATAPGGFSLMVEDRMRRWDTTTQPAGDGLGPAWRELVGPFAPGHATIVNQERALLAGNGTNLQFKPFGSDYPRSYAEALFLKHSNTTDQRYNVDVRVREFLDSTELKSYIVKLANEDDLQTSAPPYLRFLRFRGSTIEPVGDGIYPLSSLGCNAAVPLATSETTPVWLRVIVEDGLDQVPVITATIGWGGCGESENVEACDALNRCTKSVTDFDDPFGMVGKVGTWGVFNHHGSLWLETFRAGSGP
jgi:hypothetical protein